MRFYRRLLNRGLFTLPAEVREAMDIEDGDLIDLEARRVPPGQGR